MSDAREWLQPGDKSGNAAVWWWVDETDTAYQSNGFALSDCSRRVELCFDYSTGDADERANIRKKVDRLYRNVKRFRAALLAEMDLCDDAWPGARGCAREGGVMDYEKRAREIVLRQLVPDPIPNCEPGFIPATRSERLERHITQALRESYEAGLEAAESACKHLATLATTRSGREAFDLAVLEIRALKSKNGGE